MTETERHLTEEEVASAVEGGSLAPGRRRHLERCRHCMAAFAEAAEVTSEWLDDSAADRAGIGTAGGAAAAGGRRRMLPRPAWLAAPVLAALTVVVVLSGRDSEPPAFVPSPTIVSAVEAFGASGFVLPGGTQRRPAPAFRGGPPTEDQVLAAVDSLEAVWAGAPSAEVGYWRAAGLLAAGQERAARSAADAAARSFPDDAALAVVRAALAFRSGDDAQAVRLLREALERDPELEAARRNLAELTAGGG